MHKPKSATTPTVRQPSLILMLLLGSLCVFSKAVPLSAFQSTPLNIGGIEWNIQLIPQAIDFHYDNSQIVLDAVGEVHIFFTGSKDTSDRNYIYYVTPSNAAEPIDVLAAENQIWSGITLFDAVFDHHTNRLVVLWTDGWGERLHVSHALVGQGHNAHNWVTETITVDVISASMVVDPTGRLHVVYGTFSSGILEYITSSDLGLTWSAPVTLYRVADSANATIWHVRLIADPNGILHVTWSENQPNSKNVWVPSSVWYITVDPADDVVPSVAENVFDRGWDGTTDYLTVAVTPGGQMIRTWNLGAGSSPGRYQQWHSQNNWQPMQAILMPESGLGGYSRLFWDSVGNGYLVSVAQIPTSAGIKIRLSLYSQHNDVWILEGDLYECEFPDIAVYRGNQVHLICRSPRGIAYMTGDIAVAPLPISPTPSVHPAVAAIPSPTPSHTPIAYVELVTPRTSDQLPVIISDPSPSSNFVLTPIGSLLTSAASAMLVILFTLVFTIRQKRNG